MQLTKLVLKHHRFATIAFILLTIIGVNSFLNMPRTENPEMSVPAASVIVVYPGASPIDMEQLIALPVEDAVSELEDIKRISTSIRDGLVMINVEFYFGVDVDEKYDKVLQEVNRIRDDLPDDIYSLSTIKWRVSDQVLMQLAITGDSISYNVLEDKAEKLELDIKKIPEIRKVEIVAIPKQEVHINLDFQKIGALNIGIEQIINAVVSNNANIPAGSVDIGQKSLSIKTSGAYSDLNQIANTVIHSHQGKIIKIRDVAAVELDYEDDRYIGHFNGQKSVFVAIYQKEGHNVFNTTEKIQKVLAENQALFTGDVTLNTVFKQSAEVDNKISEFQDNLIQGILLVGVLILLALGFKSAFLVIIAIPLSILIGLFGVEASGYAMQQMVIAGLVIALGLLVDNAIVVTEGISRYVGKSYTPKEASILTTSEIGWPVISATLTTVLAFVPIIAMPDKAGVFIRSMPVTIIITLGVSLLLALTLTPLLATVFYKKKRVEKKEKNITLTKRILNWLIEKSYRQTIVYALKKPGLVIITAVAILLITLFVAYRFLDVSFFPKAEKGQFLIRANMPEGDGLHSTAKTVRYIERVLDTIPDIKQYTSNIGHGNPRIYYNIITRNYQKNFGEVFVQLNEYETNRFNKLIKNLRAVFNKYNAADIEVKEFEQSPPIDAPVMVYITGDNFETLGEIASKVEDILESQRGALNLNNSISKSKYDIYVEINRDKANIYGVPVHVIDQTVRAAIAGIEVDKYRDDTGEEFGIVVKGESKATSKIDLLEKIYVKSVSGKSIPLKQLANLSFREAPGEIRRFNTQRTALITADLARNVTLDEVLNPVQEFLKQYDFPKGYGYYISGELESRKESFGGMQRAVMLAILLIFAVLVVQFRSYKQPLIIFITIPLAVIGSIYALLLSGNTFSFTAFIGLTSLVGIVINNAIILVDYTNILRKEGLEVLEALRIAGETRFTPIVLTTLTTAGGLLPLTLQGGDLWAPLGWTIIGGLIVSTFLTLIVIPVVYSLMEKNSERN